MFNQEKWMAYTSGLPSPENYVRWAWYYIISASLQRRVWMGASHQQCFPNLYIILVGAPGVGKGLILKEVNTFLKHWTLDVSRGAEKLAKTPEDKATIESALTISLENAHKAELQSQSKGPKETYKPLLIPVCADSITCEALIKVIAENLRYINYVEFNPSLPDAKPKLKAYGHSSLCFVLPELSSLFKKNNNNTTNFLLSIYDCPLDHEYISISRGKDRIRRGCLNLIAGTTPSFMQSTFNEDLIGEGFTSRTFYIFAPKNRFNAWSLTSLSPEQENYKGELLEHIRKLTTLYGEAKTSIETEAWMANWWDSYCKENQLNGKHPEMIPFEARMNIHVKKLAMGIHFSEDAEQDEFGRPLNEVSLETFKKAIEILTEEKKNMHLALVLEGKHPTSKASQRILEMLSGGDKNYVDLYIVCSKLVERKQFEEALADLELMKQIKTYGVTDKDTNKEITFYKRI